MSFSALKRLLFKRGLLCDQNKHILTILSEEANGGNSLHLRQKSYNKTDT